MTALIVQETLLIHAVDALDLLVSFLEHLLLNIRDDHVFDTDGDTGNSGVLIAHCLDGVEELNSFCSTVDADASCDDIAELLLADLEVTLECELVIRVGSVYITEVLRNYLIEEETSVRGVNDLASSYAVNFLGKSDTALRLKLDIAVVVSHCSLIE